MALLALPCLAADAQATLPPVSASVPLPASAPQPASAPAAAQGDSIRFVDVPRDYLSKQFVDLVNGVDHFFGSDRNYQEANDSVVQLDWGRITGYTGQHNFYLTGRAKVRLPNTEKRLHLLVETDPDKDLNNPTSVVKPVPVAAATTTPASYGAGLRLERQSPEERWHASSDAGIKFAGTNTTPFARLRGSYSLPLDGWRFKAAETLFWFNSTGAGETTQLDFERPFAGSMLFRATSIATWQNSKQAFDLRQDFMVFQPIDDRDAMQYQASMVGTGDARMQTHVTDYVLLVLYRHRLHRNWVYLEISPQLHFPLERGYKSSGMLSIKLEMMFDKSQ